MKEELFDTLFAPFLWGYYTARMCLHVWHLNIRARCSLSIMLAQQRNLCREIAFYNQKIVEGIENPEYHAGLSARLVSCLVRYVVPRLDRGMPWEVKS
jgi:hypothetical protein